MNKEQIAIQQIKAQGMLPLFYHEDAATCIGVIRALYQAGVRSVEFTNRGNAAFENFKIMVAEKNVSMPELLLGIGTIKNEQDATAFITAGADFLVSPVYDSTVGAVARQHQLLWIPGCMTPSEIHIAQTAGCSMIKLFPGNVIGQGFVEAIAPVFSGLDFIVTGGVDTTEENIQSWFTTGVAAIGLGSKLITKNILQSGDYKKLETTTAEVIQTVKRLRQLK